MAKRCRFRHPGGWAPLLPEAIPKTSSSAVCANTGMPTLSIMLPRSVPLPELAARPPPPPLPSALSALPAFSAERPPPSSTPKLMLPRVRRKDARVRSGSAPVCTPVAGSQHTTSHRAQGPAPPRAPRPLSRAMSAPPAGLLQIFRVVQEAADHDLSIPAELCML